MDSRGLAWGLFLSFIALVIYGFGILWSASSGIGMIKYGSPHFIIKKHLFWVFLGFIFMAIIVYLIPLRFMFKYAEIFGILSLVMLFLVFIPGLGKTVKGATRWIKIGSFTLQPTEFFKLGIIFFLAKIFSLPHLKDGFSHTKSWLAGGIFVAIAFLVLIKQPDFGYAVIIVLLASFIMFVAGMPFLLFLYGAVVLIPIFYILVYKVKYRWNRIIAFLNPYSDPTGKGYQLIKSLEAMSLGGFFGQGIGASVYKYGLLPEPYTDFVFSILVEELGFLGGFLLIVLYFFIGLFGFFIYRKTESLFLKLLSIGIVFLIWIQIVFNVGVSAGIFPTTGLPLPLVSYGGSSTISFFVAISILLKIAVSEGNEAVP